MSAQRLLYGPDAQWPVVVQQVVPVLDRFLLGELTPEEYRNWIGDPDNWADRAPSLADPAYPILSQLRHDANEFIPAALPDGDAISVDVLRTRVGFARDALSALLGIWRHVNRQQDAASHDG